ncbi:MAG: hypothetical protein R3338_10150 [Thermoanaerobaculia bacterium]|nr:hypothetical protein [Thermoanaerobaculia bacterium]
MEKHVTIIGACYIALGVIGLIIGAVVVTSLVGAGLMSQDPDAMTALSLIAMVISTIFVVLAIPSFLAGIGLLKFRPWARILAIVLGILNLFNVPFGTILGIYTIVILMRDDVAESFRARS